MKAVHPSVYNAVRTGHDVKALPELVAEWNMNRYVGAVASNGSGVEENDPVMFPIESIIETLRPSKGINKARINHSTVSDSYNSPSMPRYYVASLEDKYKYWISPLPSMPNGQISGVMPTVIYNSDVDVNKIVVAVENSFASPNSWSIQVTSDRGNSWQTASSAPTIRTDGRAFLFWNGSNWSSVRPDVPNTTTRINGVRVIVNSMMGGFDNNGDRTRMRHSQRVGAPVVFTDGSNSFFSLIEISARREMDLTSRLIEVNDTFDAGSTNGVTPIGSVTSNVAQLKLWDGDREFSAQFESLMEPNAKFHLRYIYHINDVEYPVQQFTMFSESWKNNGDGTLSVELSDYSKYLKEVYPRPAMYQQATVGQIIYRLCDAVGFTDTNVIGGEYVNDFRIPIFWTDGTKTLWEIFDELATATQTLIYFDSNGRLNVKTRERAYDPNRTTMDWVFRGERSGTQLPDIVEMDQTNVHGSNVVKVKYRKTDWAESVNGFVKHTTVWEPGETVILRSTPLISGLSESDVMFYINPGESTHWPYSGFVQIEGEFIEYQAKWFNYFDNGWKGAWVRDEKEHDLYNNLSSSEMRPYNNFGGWFWIKTRGVWDTTPADHNPEAKGWTVKRYNFNTNTSWNNRACWQWYGGSSLVRMSSNGELNNTNQYAIATRGRPEDTGFKHFGTKFRFNGSAVNQLAGIVFNQHYNGDGYYIEVRPSNTIENKDREKEDEVTLYSVHAGNMKRMRATWRQPNTILTDHWHELDVYFEAWSHRISVWIDGKVVMTDTIDPPNYRHAPNGRFGMFIRGKTNVDFEYMYAIADNIPPLDGDVSILDRVRGAYVGGAWTREWVYKSKVGRRWVKQKNGKTKKTNRKEYKKNFYFFDEFGPYVHEVREFEAKFDPAPVLSSKPYMSNDWAVVMPEYRADAFGAYFILANASRRNEVVSGEDSLTYAAVGQSLDQKLLVWGRALSIAEDEEVEVRNEDMVRVRGEVISEIDSDWIQDEGAAQQIANWISQRWKTSSDELQLKAFGNPLVEVGDLVGIDFVKKGMRSFSHQYFVTAVNTTFNTGIETEVTLQRKS